MLSKEDGCRGRSSGGLEAEETHAASQQMDNGLDDFQSLPFPSGCSIDPSGHYHLLLTQAEMTACH